MLLRLQIDVRKAGELAAGKNSPMERTPNFSLNADAIWRPLRGRAVAGQLWR